MSNEGKKVKVDYIGTFDDGTVFDSSFKSGQPLEFVCMGGQMIDGFDKAVAGMEVGETIKVHLTAEEAYGPYEDEAVQDVPLDQIPNAEALPVGKRIFLSTDGGMMPVLVVKVENGMATFDMNHPMAGKELNFEITLISAE